MTLAGAALWTADSLFALRPLLWIPAVALFAAGAAAQGVEPPADRSLPSLLLLLAAVHLANSGRDAASDRANRKGMAFTSGIVGRGRILALSALALAGALGLALETGPRERGLLALAALLGGAYVAPGVELKRRAGWDVAANGIGYGGVAFLLGSQSAGAPQGAHLPGLLAAAPYVCGVAAVSVATMIADLEGDEEAGLRTTAAALGAPKAAELATLFAWTSGLLGLLLRDPVPALWGILAGAWLALTAGRRDGRVAWNRIAIALQAGFLAVLVSRTWLPLAFAVAVGGATTLYNRARFGTGYPMVTR